MEIVRREAPFACEDVLALWAKIFGKEEALLEKTQIDGSETAFNRDVMYVAYENGKAVGTIHATFPKAAPMFCGLSGMCTDQAVRGTGLGRILFEKIVEESEKQGAEYTFLGTSNPLAAKLYHSCGFSFLPGTNIMARFKDGGRFDMDSRFFREKPAGMTVCEGTPAERIPLIPLAAYRGPFFLMDRNTGIFTSDVVNQVSCMGLYPRYADLADRGGRWFTAEDTAAKVPGALLSAVPAEGRVRADFFCADGFLDAVPELLSLVSGEDVFFEVFARDEKKRELLQKNGYRPVAEKTVSVREFMIPCITYEK
ncbi:MAG: GNAT family N-acetyltransferase [Eubacteriales bacterium]|nr:GNAT family N-acetyltransferase [Eubacteriales bacterium]